MRVLHVWRNGGDDGGGAQRAIRDILRATKQAGCSPVIAAGAGSFDFGVEKIEIPTWGRSRGEIPKLALALRRAVREVRPDVIHCHSLGLGFLLETVAWRRPPIVVGLHGLPDQFYSKRLSWPLRVGRARVVAYGPGTSDSLRRIGVEHRLLYIGISAAPAPATRSELAAVAGVAAESRIVVCVGRLVPQKNQQVLVQALVHLPQDVACVLIGEGGDRSQLSELADQLGVADRLQITGWREDARALLAAADVVAMPSRWEGFGLAALEGMQAGVPLVVSDAPGLREWIENDATALFAPVDDVEATAAAIGRLLDEPDLGERLSASALEYGGAFTLERMRDEHVALYRELIA